MKIYEKILWFACLIFLWLILVSTVNSQIIYNKGLQSKIVDYTSQIEFWLKIFKQQPAEYFDSLVVNGYMGKQGNNYYFNVALKEEFNIKDQNVKLYWQSDPTLQWVFGKKLFAWYNNDQEPREPTTIYYQEYKIQIKEKGNIIKLSYPKLKEYKTNGKSDLSSMFGYRKGSVIKFADRKKPKKDKEPPVRSRRGRTIR